MLQWMGGARRKVNASRKSTRNRQKQYFEQRKRLQQRGLENSTDELRDKLPDNHKEPRSLDILSLLNLATVKQQENSTHDNVGSHESSTLMGTLPCQIVKETAVLKLKSDVSNVSSAPVTKKIISKYANDLQQARSKQENVLGNNSSAESYSKISAHESDQQLDESQRLANADDLMLDLLNDDDPGRVSEGRLVPESHVAFSVEGLGNMGVGTPAQSPHFKARDCAPPPRASRQAYSSAKPKSIVFDFGFELDDIMSDVKMVDDESLTGNLCNRRHTVDELQSKKRSKVLGSIPDVYLSKSSTFKSDENFFTYIDDMEEQDLVGTQKGSGPSSIANAGYFHELFVDERSYELALLVDRNCGFPVHWEDDDSDCEFGFQLPISTTDRTLRASKGKFDNSEPFVPQSRCSPSGKECGFVSSDSKRIPSANKSSNFETTFDPHPWSPLGDDAAHDRSSLSEESCSSTAVREEGSYDFNTHWDRKRHNNITFSDEQESSPASKYGGRFDRLHRKLAYDPCVEYSESAAFLQPVCDPLFTKRHTVKAASASGLFCTVSAKRERSSSSKSLPEENPLDSFCIPKPLPSTDIKHGRSESIVQDSQVMCGEFIHKSAPEWATQNTFQNASYPWDLTKLTEFPDASKKVRHHSQDACTRGSNMSQLSSMKKSPVMADMESATNRECKSSSTEHEESKLGTQESKDCQKLRDHQHEESITAEDVLDRCNHDKIHLYGSSPPMPFQFRNADSRKDGSEKMSEVYKSYNGSDTSYQVMLGSYVLQLLCVQKVLMETSGENLKKDIQGSWLEKTDEAKVVKE